MKQTVLLAGQMLRQLLYSGSVSGDAIMHVFVHYQSETQSIADTVFKHISVVVLNIPENLMVRVFSQTKSIKNRCVFI